MNRSQRKIYTDSILAAVAREWGVSVAALTGTSRMRHLSQARGAACALLYEPETYSYPMVARKIGMKNHTSAIHAVRRGLALFEQDRALEARLRADMAARPEL